MNTAKNTTLTTQVRRALEGLNLNDDVFFLRTLSAVQKIEDQIHAVTESPRSYAKVEGYTDKQGSAEQEFGCKIEIKDKKSDITLIIKFLKRGKKELFWYLTLPAVEMSNENQKEAEKIMEIYGLPPRLEIAMDAVNYSKIFKNVLAFMAGI